MQNFQILSGWWLHISVNVVYIFFVWIFIEMQVGQTHSEKSGFIPCIPLGLLHM